MKSQQRRQAREQQQQAANEGGGRGQGCMQQQAAQVGQKACVTILCYCCGRCALGGMPLWLPCRQACSMLPGLQVAGRHREGGCDQSILWLRDAMLIVLKPRCLMVFHSVRHFLITGVPVSEVDVSPD
jgi:hypothetical protein